MTNGEKRTLMLASFIKTFFNQYSIQDNDCNLSLLKLKQKVQKGLMQCAKKDYDEFFKVYHVDADKIWKESLEHFDTPRIEISQMVSELISRDEKQLCKKYFINMKLFEKWHKPLVVKDAYDIEQNSRKVVNYIESKICDLYGLEHYKPATFKRS